MKKYLIMILSALILLTSGVSVIAVKLCTAEYSPNVYVTVENKMRSESVSSYQPDDTPESKTESTLHTNSYKKTENAPINSENNKTVYITPYGLKYHFRKTCAGKNATEINLDNASETFSPCSKCVN